MESLDYIDKIYILSPKVVELAYTVVLEAIVAIDMRVRVPPLGFYQLDS